MPKIFENKVVYDYPTSYTLSLLHQKYPNPYATHVVSVDTVSRSVDPETGIVRSERVIGVEQGAPKWITKLFKLPPTAYVREVIFVDPSVPSATMMSQNLNYAEYVSCLELITYTPHEPDQSGPSRPARMSVLPIPQSDPPEPPQTLFHQRALLVSKFPTAMIARRIEAASLDRFSSNAGVGKQGFDWVLAGGQTKGSGFWTKLPDTNQTT